MALFGRTTKEKEEKAPVLKKVTASTASLSLPTRDLSRVLVKPRLTEKAVRMSDANVYTFEVARSATKFDIKAALKIAYDVVPKKIHVVSRPPRKKMKRSRGRKVHVSGMKKAYVYLKKGDSINLV